MTSTLGRLVTLAAVAALSATGLSGCGLLDGSSPIEDALEYLPDDTTNVTFVDRKAIAERQELADLETGASDKDLEDWADAQTDEGYATDLANYVRLMQEAAFSEFDVDWQVTGTSEDRLVRVWKLNDDADFDDIADDLEDAGYSRSTKGDAEVFTINASEADPTTTLFGDRYPAVLLNLALIPDEHLILSGDVEEGLDVATDGKDSLADSGRFDDLLDKAPNQDLEYAGMSVDPACGSRNISPAQQEEVFGALGSPSSLAFFAAGEDDPLTAVRLFKSSEAAEDDENSLVTYLEGTAQASGLDADFDVTTDGDAVLAETGFSQRRAVSGAWNKYDGPFACAPS